MILTRSVYRLRNPLYTRWKVLDVGKYVYQQSIYNDEHFTSVLYLFFKFSTKYKSILLPKCYSNIFNKSTVFFIFYHSNYVCPTPTALPNLKISTWMMDDFILVNFLTMN